MDTSILKLQASTRTGGKGTPRLKTRVVNNKGNSDNNRIQLALKKLQLNTIPGIDEVSMFTDDNKILHFEKPKVQGSLQSKTFTVSGRCQTRSIESTLSSIPGAKNRLKTEDSIIEGTPNSANHQVANDDDDDIPELLGNIDAD